MKKKVTSDKKKEKASLDDFSWLVPRRTRRSLVASLVTVFVLVTCHSGNPLAGRVTVFALAQSQTTGRIAGTVKDQNGAVIVGAAVTVTSLGTAGERKATTDTDGYYAVPLLSPGTYRVRITAGGFNPALDVARVVITETTTVNAELAVAGLSAETLTVSAAPFIQAGGPQLGRVVDSRAVAELPLATRNFTQILALSPGNFADLPDNTALGRNSQGVSVNGARPTQNNFEINGIDANSLSQNNAISVAVPAPETIQEFKIQPSLYDAAFGRGAGGSVQAVTRSGTNAFHGAAYEYFRDDAFNANNPFLKAAGVERPVLRRSVFGGLVGGPRQNREGVLLRLVPGHQRAQRRVGQQPHVQRFHRPGVNRRPFRTDAARNLQARVSDRAARNLHPPVGAGPLEYKTA